MNQQDITLLFNLVTRDIKILDEEPDDKPYGAVAEKVAFANEIDCMELSEIKDILLYEINDLKYIKTDFYEDLMELKRDITDGLTCILSEVNNKIS